MSTQTPDYITDGQASKVFEYLDTVAVRLEKDPTVMGPSYVHEKLKQCRDFSIEVEQLLVNYYNVQRLVKNELRRAKAAYRAQRAELMALDAWVNEGRSATDRESRADLKLKQDVAKVEELEDQLVTVNYVIKSIELKKEGLNRTNNDIKKQVSLMEFARSNSIPLDDDFDDVVDGSGTELDDNEDLTGLFADDDLPTPEDPPGDIPKDVSDHLDDDPDDPITDQTLDPNEEADQLLQEIVFDDPVDEAEGDEVDADELAGLFEDLDSDLESVTTNSVVTSVTAPKHTKTDDVVDIGAYLDAK